MYPRKPAIQAITRLGPEPRAALERILATRTARQVSADLEMSEPTLRRCVRGETITIRTARWLEIKLQVQGGNVAA